MWPQTCGRYFKNKIKIKTTKYQIPIIMKKQELKLIYENLNEAKLSKMEDTDKYKVIKIMREMKPIYTEIVEAAKDAQNKLKAENHDSLLEKVRTKKLSDKELKSAQMYFKKFEKDVYEAVKDILETEIELKEKISVEAFEKLIASNDFSVAVMVALEDAIVE